MTQLKTLFAQIGIFILVLLATGCGNDQPIIHISSSENNDLYNILRDHGQVNVMRHNSPMTALKKAQKGEALLILADEYPEERVPLSIAFFEGIKEKNLKVYLEFPSFLPGTDLAETMPSKVERMVINSSFFNNSPDSLDILSVGGLNFIPTDVEQSHLVAARIAGFDTAVFGLPNKTYPILFELPEHNAMVSTTNLSKFVSGRYAPQEAWEGVWTSILNYILPETKIESLKWNPVVQPAFTKNEPLPENFEIKSIEKGINWYLNSKMLVPNNFEKVIDDAFEPEINTGWISWNDSIPDGDGSQGVFECIFSKIDENGNQPIGIIRRGDCTGESAMAFACAGKALNQKNYYTIADNLINYFLLESPATKNEYNDPNHGAYGLAAWGFQNYAWFRANYADDNARLLLGALATASITGSEQWDEKFMKLLLGMYRTTGIHGFRGNRIDLPDFEKNGWKHYYDRDIINMAPHYEAYLWACMLWAYDKTGDPMFLERTEKAIQMTMENYPNGWRWANGMSQEIARMILPLAWLVRVKNTEKNRKMLLKMVNELIELQDETGGIREVIGNLKTGVYPPPQSNEAYGTNEASLIGTNGDMVSDLLYTTNFAFFGLHEAYYATKDPQIKSACDQLAEFLCRVQVDSKRHPEIDGGWMRAFDFGRFEHWGSNADHGWGAWAIESGWTQGWIVSILALRKENTSIWDLTQNSKVNKYYPILKKEMLPNL